MRATKKSQVWRAVCLFRKIASAVTGICPKYFLPSFSPIPATAERHNPIYRISLFCLSRLFLVGGIFLISRAEKENEKKGEGLKQNASSSHPSPFSSPFVTLSPFSPLFCSITAFLTATEAEEEEEGRRFISHISHLKAMWASQEGKQKAGSILPFCVERKSFLPSIFFEKRLRRYTYPLEKKPIPRTGLPTREMWQGEAAWIDAIK